MLCFILRGFPLKHLGLILHFVDALLAFCFLGLLSVWSLAFLCGVDPLFVSVFAVEVWARFCAGLLLKSVCGWINLLKILLLGLVGKRCEIQHLDGCCFLSLIDDKNISRLARWWDFTYLKETLATISNQYFLNYFFSQIAYSKFN